MATLVLGIAGSAIGGALLPGGLSLLGTALTGKVIGSTIGTIAGAFVDQALLGPLTGATGQTSVPQGPRVSDLKLGSSSEGTPLPRVYGKARLPGQLIWATRFKEKKEKVKQQTAGGKNATSTTGSGKNAKTIKYTYFANVAYALCEGPITRIGTIWADGKKLKKNKFDFDIHYRTETQTPDDFRMDLPSLHFALRASVRGGRRRRRLHHGIRAHRGDHAPIQRLDLPLRGRSGRYRRRRKGSALARHQAHLWCELDGAPGLCAA
jgi:hypothetical protein